MAEQKSQQQENSRRRRHPAAARKRHRQPRHDGQRRVSQHDARDDADPARQQKRQRQRQHQLQQAREMIRVDVSARCAARIRRGQVPDVVRVMEKLRHRVGRSQRGHRRERVSDRLRRVLAVQIVDHRQEQKRIQQNADQLQPRDIFNVRREIPRHRIEHERRHRPRQRRPEQFRFVAAPQPHRPQHQHADDQRLHHEERPRIDRAECQRREHQRRQHERQNAALAPPVQISAGENHVGKNEPRPPASKARRHPRRKKWRAEKINFPIPGG